jgi:hypothetical protein
MKDWRPQGYALISKRPAVNLVPVRQLPFETEEHSWDPPEVFAAIMITILDRYVLRLELGQCGLRAPHFRWWARFIVDF